MAKTCIECGATLADDAKFCSMCGRGQPSGDRVQSVSVTRDVRGDVNVAGRDIIKAEMGELRTCHVCGGQGERLVDCKMCGGYGHSTGNVILDWLFHLVVMWNPKTWASAYRAMVLGDKDADTAFRKQWPKCLTCEGEGKVPTTCDYCSGQGHVRL